MFGGLPIMTTVHVGRSLTLPYIFQMEGYHSIVIPKEGFTDKDLRPVLALHGFHINLPY